MEPNTFNSTAMASVMPAGKQTPKIQLSGKIGKNSLLIYSIVTVNQTGIMIA